MEYGFRILRKKKFSLLLAAGLVPSFWRSQTIPKNANSFDQSINILSLKACITSRIQYKMGKRIGLDFNTSLYGIGFFRQWGNDVDPNIPNKIITINRVLSNPEQFQMRLGVFYKL